MRKSALLVILLMISLLGISQDGKFNLGARSSGMAGASLTLDDEFSLFNNVGGLGRFENHAAFAGYQNRYGITEFQVIGGGGIYNSDFGTAGIGYFKFGDDVFSQQRVHVAFGNRIQMVSLGLGLDLVQYDVSTIGSQQVLAIQFGGVAEITPQFLFGAHIFNINQAEIVSETGERLPTVMKGGLSYRPTEELMINAEIEKDLDFDEIIKVGLEYEVIDNVFVRTGISTEPFIGAFGVGFHPKNFRFDYSFSNDSQLGNTHEVSISYLLSNP